MSSMIDPGTTVREASVSVGPGAMALIRMSEPPSSCASWMVIPLIPVLANP